MAEERGMFMVHQTVGSVLCCKCSIPMAPNAAIYLRWYMLNFFGPNLTLRGLKSKLRVQKEVLNGAILEQAYTVEYFVQDQMCESCTRVQANPDQWVAAVQLRQHVSHRRTFFYLEQLILKHDAAARAIRIKQMDKGIDFFFGNRNHAVKFVDFLGKVTPIRSRHDKQLVSHDPKSNNYNTSTLSLLKSARYAGGPYLPPTKSCS
ncbi:nonsense-mediated mRNA decay NMD3 family protein [Actinidia rufa]|uniref:60S ribosomal export protein NMD3 n=1 Tax=Actinidia rufa TaxID=165716 RepID=A0A7J0F6A4_9ERIC|nr:nonsense-mediated mRNA decay NMD3 family protein [Actinidia rufa]